MAAGPTNIYTAAKNALLAGQITLGSDTLYAVLVAAAYTPVLPTDATYANISANEVTGTGYTAGGQLLASVALTNYVSGVSVNNGGTGYVAGDVGKVVTLGGGTSTTAATVNIVSVSGGAVTAVSVASGGTYTVDPGNGAATSGGGTTGSGLTINPIMGTQLSANNPSWGSATITAKYCVIVQRAGGSTAGTDKLLGYIDLNTASTASTVSSTNGTFTVQFNGGASSGQIFAAT